MRLFKRKLELNLLDEAGDGIDLGELSVMFTVTQTVAQSLNRVKIDIFNLSLDTINRIGSQDLRTIELTAGYEDTAGLIFRGNVSNMFTRQEGPDRITEIFAQDGLRGYRFAVARLSVSNGTSLRKIVQTIAAQFPEEIAPPNLAAVPDVTILGALTILEPARTALDKLAESYGFTWSIHNHSLRIIGPDRVDGTPPIPVNFESGLIGSPVVSSKRLEFTTLLNPAIHPTGAVEVTSATGASVQAPEALLAAVDLRETLFGIDGGVFTVSEVEHVGETRGSQWYSKVVCHPFVQPAAAA